MVTQDKLDKKLNRKLHRMAKAYRHGLYCRKIYEEKRNRVIADYYAKSKKLEEDGK